MLKKASGASENGLLSAWRRLFEARWSVVTLVLVPVLVVVIGLVIEYTVIKPGTEANGPFRAWTVEYKNDGLRSQAKGQVLVAHDGKVHVSGSVKDMRQDSMGATIRVVASNKAGNPVFSDHYEATDKVTSIAYIEGKGSSVPLNADTEEVDATVCTSNKEPNGQYVTKGCTAKTPIWHADS